MGYPRGKLTCVPLFLVLTWITWISAVAKHVECDYEVKYLDQNQAPSTILRTDYEYCVSCSDIIDMKYGTGPVLTTVYEDIHSIGDGYRPDGKWHCIKVGSHAFKTIAESQRVKCSCSKRGSSTNWLEEKIPIHYFQSSQTGACGGHLRNGVCLVFAVSPIPETIRPNCPNPTEGQGRICDTAKGRSGTECRFLFETWSKGTKERALLYTNESCPEKPPQDDFPFLGSTLTVSVDSNSMEVPCFGGDLPDSCTMGSTKIFPGPCNLMRQTAKIGFKPGDVDPASFNEVKCAYGPNKKWWGFLVNTTMESLCDPDAGLTTCKYPKWTKKIIESNTYDSACKEELKIYTSLEQNLKFKSAPFQCNDGRVRPVITPKTTPKPGSKSKKEVTTNWTGLYVLIGLISLLLILCATVVALYFVGRKNLRDGKKSGFPIWTYRKGRRFKRKHCRKMRRSGTNLNRRASEIEDAELDELEKEEERAPPIAESSGPTSTHAQPLSTSKAQNAGPDSEKKKTVQNDESGMETAMEATTKIEKSAYTKPKSLDRKQKHRGSGKSKQASPESSTSTSRTAMRDKSQSVSQSPVSYTVNEWTEKSQLKTSPFSIQDSPDKTQLKPPPRSAVGKTDKSMYKQPPGWGPEDQNPDTTQLKPPPSSYQENPDKTQFKQPPGFRSS